MIRTRGTQLRSGVVAQFIKDRSNFTEDVVAPILTTVVTGLRRAMESIAQSHRCLNR